MDSDDEQLELDRLAAELRVSQSPVLPARRNVGGDVVMEGVDPLEVQGRSEGVGMFVETVPMDQDTEVAGLYSGDESFDMIEASQDQRRTSTSGSKKTQIFLVPKNQEDFARFCFNLIGAGSVFCTSKDCTIAHRGGAFKSLSPGDVFVAKSTTEALWSLGFTQTLSMTMLLKIGKV